MLSNPRGLRQKEKQKDGSVLSLRGKRGRICVELKPLGGGRGLANGILLGLWRDF